VRCDPGAYVCPNECPGPGYAVHLEGTLHGVRGHELALYAAYSAACALVRNRRVHEQTQSRSHETCRRRRRPVFVRNAQFAGGKASLRARIMTAPSCRRRCRARCGGRGASGEARPFQRTRSISAILAPDRDHGSQNRSKSARDSISVGSILSVPGTGKLMVGAGETVIVSRLANSSR